MKAASEVLSPRESAFLVRQRVARLATADAASAPHVVPVCFAYDGRGVFIALDEKPKDVPATRLKRVRNMLENPSVALVADRYAEDWSLLAFVMVRGRAELLEPGAEEHRAAVREGVQSLNDTHPEVRVKWLPCGHNVPLQQPGELARLIVEFVS